MNVVQGDKFNKGQLGKNRQDGRVYGFFKLHQNPRNGILASNDTILSGNLKTPRYSFDGVLSSAGPAVTPMTTTNMGPPMLPARFGRKRSAPSTGSGPSPMDSFPNCNASSHSFHPLSGMQTPNTSGKSLWTPRYGRTRLPSSSNSRGPVSGGRSHTTPCSTTSNTSVPESCIILAVSEGRGAARGEVGMAAVDLRRPHLELCQLSDSHSYLHSLTKIHYFQPVEIIVPHTFSQGVVPTELYRLLRDQFPSVRLTSVQRKNFSDTSGIQQIQHLCAPEYSSVQLQLMHKFYALIAAAAVLKYVEYIQCVIFAPHSLKIEYHGSQSSTLIDVETAIRLELVESLSGATDRGSSLLSTLNYTHTAGGLRALRADVLQPPCEPQRIASRLSCVEELLNNSEGLMPALQSVLRQLYDVDKVLWLCMQLPTQDGSRAGEAQLSHTLQLQATAALIPALVNALRLTRGHRFQLIKNDLEDPKFAEISLRISRVLHDNITPGRSAGAHLQRCFSVRPGINGLLDVARRSYCELISDAQARVQQLAEEYTLPLKLDGSARGLRLQISGKGARKYADNLPPVFLEVQTSGYTLTMTTEEIILLDQQARESLSEIQTMSNIVIFGLLTELRPYMGVLYKLCEHVAELDVMVSLAQVSSAGHYVKPTFNKYLELKESIHPMLDYLISTSPVSNDIFSSPEYNFHIITGPNMGGKSIYIKQITLLQIMAQIGCFVPASSAVFRITDHIFSRIGFNDSIECNASTYVLEMKEIHYILQTITPTSLIIVDELCRGTSSEEGTSMAWAVCEHLLNTEAFTFFTTHFLYLTKLQDLYPNVTNLHTDAEEVPGDGEKCKKLIYKHKVLPGVTYIEHYGLTLASNTNLPPSVVSLAHDLAAIIAKHKKPLPASDQIKSRDFLVYKLAADMIQKCRTSEVTDENLNEIIKTFKALYPDVTNASITKNVNAIGSSSVDTSEKDGSVSRRSNKSFDTVSKNKRGMCEENPLSSIQEMSLLNPELDSYITPMRKTLHDDRPHRIVNDSNLSSESNNKSFIENSFDFADNRFQKKIVLNRTHQCSAKFNSLSSPTTSGVLPDNTMNDATNILLKKVNFLPDLYMQNKTPDKSENECSNLTNRLNMIFQDLSHSSGLSRTTPNAFTPQKILENQANKSFMEIVGSSENSSKMNKSASSLSFQEYTSFVENESETGDDQWNESVCSGEASDNSVAGETEGLSDIEKFIDDVVVTKTE